MEELLQIYSLHEEDFVRKVRQVPSEENEYKIRLKKQQNVIQVFFESIKIRSSCLRENRKLFVKQKLLQKEQSNSSLIAELKLVVQVE